MNSEELMVENPMGFTILFYLLTNNFPVHLPFSNQFLEQFILKDAMLTVNFHGGMIGRHVQRHLARPLHLRYFLYPASRRVNPTI